MFDAASDARHGSDQQSSATDQPYVGCADAAARLQSTTVCLVTVSLGIAAILSFLSETQIDLSDGSAVLQLIAGLLLASAVLRRRWRRTWIPDFFGSQGLVMLCGLACGFISLIGLRFHFPRVDDRLHEIDLALGLDGRAFASWISHRSSSAHVLLTAAYTLTVPIVFVSLLLQALMKRQLEVWRAAFCFAGSLLTVCLVSILTPAKGLGLWLTHETLGRLPPGAARYFWTTFDSFYDGHALVLRTGAIDGVVSFPSFHIIMGMITITLWRAHALTLVLSLMWFVTMLVATVPLGGHYFIDLIGGLAIWIIWFALSRTLHRSAASA